jgi:hypothetical protein
MQQYARGHGPTRGPSTLYSGMGALAAQPRSGEANTGDSSGMWPVSPGEAPTVTHVATWGELGEHAPTHVTDYSENERA